MAYAAVAVALTRSNINVASPASAAFDGYTVANGNRVLLTGQTTAPENGVWIFNGAFTPMSRPTGQDQYASGNVLDNATLIPVTNGTTYAATVWGIDPAKVVIVDTDSHTLGRVVLPPVQARCATTADINLASTFPIIDGRTVSDGVMNTGGASTTLTCSTSAPFNSGDVGKAIVVAGAGVAAADLVTTIAGYTSASVVTLTTGCSTSVGAADVEFGVKLAGLGAAGADIILVKDQTTASENGLYWANTGGAMVRCTEPLVPSRTVAVSEGSLNKYGRWSWVSSGGVTLFSPQSLVINLNDYGAVANADFAGGGTPCADAVEAAIKALDAADPWAGGTIVVSATPGTGYRLERTVNVTRACRIKGQGNSIVYPGSTFVADAGVTAFRVHSSFSSPSPDGGQDFLCEDLSVVAAGKLTTSTTGTFTPTNTTLPVAAAGDFVNGQLISIDGAGRPTELAEVTAATTAASASVVFASTGDQVPVLRAGQYVQIGTAYPTPTEILTVDLFDPLTVTMASNAATTLAASPASYCPSLITRIISGGGTTTWIIDATDSESLLTACTIKHADSAFDILVRSSYTRVTAGDALGHGFAGAGFTVRGSHAYVPQTNTNLSSFEYCQSYANRHAFWANGPDANGSRIHIISLQSVEFAFVDLSLLGNTYSACHADGGQGYVNADHLGSACLYSGCYAEGGTFSSFGDGAVIAGGTMPIFAGGFKLGATVNTFTVGRRNETRHETYFEPHISYLRLKSSSAEVDDGGLVITAEAEAINGYFQFVHLDGFRTHPIVIADTDQSAFKIGSLWFPTDFWFGEIRSSQLLDTVEGARMASYRSDAIAGAVSVDPAAGPFENNAYTEDPKDAFWKKGDWIRDANLLDGCPTRHVTETGHRAPEWLASTSYAQYAEVCPTVNNHSGSFFVKRTAGSQSSGATEPTWTTAPNPGDTLTDNAVTWTNAGAAAYTQPVELDGYIVRNISGNETWAQPDRHFLCGSVEVTGTLAGDATLTVPVGRYKRWIWNNTVGGFNLLIKCATGSTVTIAAGKAAEVQCTGVEIRRRTADVTP